MMLKQTARMYKVMVILILLIDSIGLMAQGTGHPFYKFTHYTSQNGLPQNSILAIMQDDQGYLWFGTDDGLAKFDSYQFTVYKHQFQQQSSLSNNVIRGLIQDKNGYIWISTEGGGINIFDPRTNAFVSLLQSGLVPSQKTGKLMVDHDGTIWVSTLADGIYQIKIPKGFTPKNLLELTNNLGVKQFTTYNSQLADNKIWQVFEDNQQLLWIGTYDHGVQQFDPKENEFTTVELNNQGSIIRSVKSFFQDSKGNFWLGTENHGVFKRSSKDIKFLPFQTSSTTLKKGNITSFLEDGQGHIWIGTLGAGLYVFELDTKKIFHYDENPSDPYSLNGQSVYSLFEDREENIWIGMYSGEGLNKINPSAQHFEHYRPQPGEQGGLSGKMVKSILIDHAQNLWVGIFNGGLDVKKTGNERFSSISFTQKGKKENSSLNVQVIYEDREQKIWIGTDGSGLYQYSPLTKEIKLFQHDYTNPYSLSKDEVWALVEDKEGFLWVGTANGGGLNRFDPQTGQFKHYFHQSDNQNTPSFNDVRALLIDSKNRLWVGTYGGGLNLFDFKTEKFTYFRHNPKDSLSISHDIITSIYEDQKGNLWVGTFGGGLNQMKVETYQFIHYREKDGLPSDVIKAILEDDSGQLWISTVKGLTSFNPQKGTFKNYSVEDGLQSNEFNLGSAFKAKSGKMYFGGTNGFNAFLPDQIKLPIGPGKPTLTKFRIHNQLVEPGDTLDSKVVLQKHIGFTKEVTLSHQLNSFEFEFSAMNFNHPGKNHYAYKLEGFDQNWMHTDANRRYASYTNLEAGNYTFHVKSTSENGLYESEETTLNLTVLPPWYKSNLAYVAYGILLILIAYIAKSIITFRIRLKNDLRFERLEHQKQEEINQLKLRFFTNISHELRTPLMLIKVPLEQLLGRTDLSQQVLYQLNSIHNNASRLLRLINQLLEFRKQESGHLKLQVQENNLKAFLNSIYQSFDGIAKKKNIDFQLIMDDELPKQLWFDLDQMEKVCYNLCYNAFKFTPDNGNIKLKAQNSTLEINEKHVVGIKIIIEDNGKGIPPEHQDRIFERFFQIEDSERNISAGTGIGLALSKNIIELHHGKIDMSSVPHHKTAFTIFLRNGKEHFNSHELKGQPNDPKTNHFSPEQEISAIDLHMLSSNEKTNKKLPVDPSLQNKKLLLVEDNEELLSLMKGILQQYFQVFVATNGSQGIQRALDVSPDIIISDVMMPKMDGVEMCSLIKKSIETSHIPVILLTARNSYDYQREGYASGADDYLSKPFPLDILIAKIRNLLLTREKIKSAFRQRADLSPAEIAISPADADLIKKAIKVIEKHMDNADFDITTFVKEMGMSRTLLFSKLKAVTDHTPNDFIQTIRLKRAAQLLMQSQYKVSEISYMVGFNNPKYFSKCFQKQFGSSPSSYSKNKLNSH
ncbi:hybrid sensor histidine kinase/response regulator transcription factor [Echinicola sp. 20G]|uniref:hybrid sensor histidine kinase/response regulator transcription factor n=1 Tax=Echinicola sp. 20G TaxID=2781961 RepID=UPI001F3B329D|nr:hybrid sensor histidine kinase/response regulator transcription factor [Echinicola sp. 20G]